MVEKEQLHDQESFGMLFHLQDKVIDAITPFLKSGRQTEALQTWKAMAVL